MIKKMKTLPVLFFLIFLIPALPLTAFAQQGENYIVGKLGGYSPESSELTDSGFGTDFSGGFDVGHYFNQNFAVEAGFGYLQTSGNAFDATDHIFVQDDINATYLEATAKLVLPVPYYYYSPGYPYMDLYVGAGGGIYFANEDIDVAGLHASDTVGGVHLLGGADFNINRQFFLGMEFKYLWARPDLIFGKTNLDGLIFSGTFGYNF